LVALFPAFTTRREPRMFGGDAKIREVVGI
jgi:hypothetical protein